MSRICLTAFATFLLAWNSVLGGMNALVLCLHPQGAMHVELLGKDASAADDCVGAEHAIRASDCPSCTDYVLGSADLGPTRTQEVASVQVPTPLVTDQPQMLPGVASANSRVVARSHPTRGPPEVESASVMFRRLIVLRL